ncbi:MAG: metallophosphoesterase family protein [Candidatus Geothermincolia bacterium]
MNERTYRWLRAVGIIILAVIVLYGFVAINVYSSVGRYPANYPLPAAHIRDIVWPTIGYPEIVAPGAEMQVELEIPSGETRIGSIEATLTPVRPELAGLAYTIQAVSAAPGKSQHWPAGTDHGRETLWRATFGVPASAVPELYNLYVQFNVAGRRVADSQPNAVSIMKQRKQGDFRFITLTDVHVHERNVSGFMAPQTNKGIAPDGTPVFFQRAIDQVNLIRPDFVVMMGDYVFAQRRPGEYQVEFAEFYKQLLRFRVPVFMAPGNHDQYLNQVNGAEVFEDNIGPLYYSFEVGNSHFTVVNTSQWPGGDRTVMSKFNGLFNFPRKWQGQVLKATDERKPETYRGQLAWVRDDLVSSHDSANRFLVMHHDPFRKNGKAAAWKNERFGGIITLGGSGTGSTALKTLAAKYHVGYAMTGHMHSDYVGYDRWTDKTGSTGYVNQTMVYFDDGEKSKSYPGYRLWNVRGQTVSGFNYVDDFHSVPLYDGSVLNGKTDLGKLDREALSSASSGAGFTAWSYLGIPMNVKGLIGVFPTSPQPRASGGTVYQSVPLPGDPSRSLLYIEANVGPGVPGLNAETPGTRAETTVQLR